MNIVEVNYNWKKSWANISTAKSERRRKEMEGGERKAGSATFFVSKPEIFHSSGYAKNVNSLNPTSYEPRFVSSFFFFSFFLFFSFPHARFINYRNNIFYAFYTAIPLQTSVHRVPAHTDI